MHEKLKAETQWKTTVEKSNKNGQNPQLKFPQLKNTGTCMYQLSSSTLLTYSSARYILPN